MYYLSLDNLNLHPIVIRDVWCVKGVMFYRKYFNNKSLNGPISVFIIID